MIKSVKLTNFLSFGANAEEIDLRALNVIIGRNGSGKSNFIEAIDLFRSAPSAIAKAIRDGGGVADWLYKGAERGTPAEMEFVVENRSLISRQRFSGLKYQVSFVDEGQRFAIVDEKITSEKPEAHHLNPYIFYDYNYGKPLLNIRDKTDEYHQRKLSHDDISQEQSILAQRRDPESYPEITALAKELEKFKLYRDPHLGRYTVMRSPVKVDAPNDFLEENCANLPLVLNQLEFLGKKQALLEELKLFYNDVEYFTVRLDSGTAQLFFHENKFGNPVPATRLSDGTLRYLSLLCILLHPTPPPVICIEEPELGLHSDILPTVGKLLKEASARCQLIVTTHSAMLVDSLSEDPECVLIAEKDSAGTTLAGLDKDKLQPWLARYRLGELWSRGDIGGNIW